LKTENLALKIWFLITFEKSTLATQGHCQKPAGSVLL